MMRALRTRIYSSESTCALVQTWDDLKFAQVRDQLPDKGAHAQLKQIVENEAELHALLPAHYQDSACHRDRLLEAVRYEPIVGSRECSSGIERCSITIAR